MFHDPSLAILKRAEGQSYVEGSPISHPSTLSPFSAVARSRLLHPPQTNLCYIHMHISPYTGTLRSYIIEVTAIRRKHVEHSSAPPSHSLETYSSCHLHESYSLQGAQGARIQGKKRREKCRIQQFLQENIYKSCCSG